MCCSGRWRQNGCTFLHLHPSLTWADACQIALTKQSRRCFYWTAFQTAKNATFAASPRPLDEMAIAAAHYWAVGSRSISDHNQDNGGCEQWTHCPHSCLSISVSLSAKRTLETSSVHDFRLEHPRYRYAHYPRESFGIGLFVLIDLQAREIPLVIQHA